MALPAGGGAFVRAVGGRCAFGVWRGLLRWGLLQHPRASSPQIAASSLARYGSYGLWARHERHEVVLDVLLQGSVKSGADARRIRFASREFCYCG